MSKQQQILWDMCLVAGVLEMYGRRREARAAMKVAYDDPDPGADLSPDTILGMFEACGLRGYPRLDMSPQVPGLLYDASASGRPVFVRLHDPEQDGRLVWALLVSGRGKPISLVRVTPHGGTMLLPQTFEELRTGEYIVLAQPVPGWEEYPSPKMRRRPR